jgi:hypothetical protein
MNMFRRSFLMNLEQQGTPKTYLLIEGSVKQKVPRWKNGGSAAYLRIEKWFTLSEPTTLSI